jgi:hypothetical protein
VLALRKTGSGQVIIDNGSTEKILHLLDYVVVIYSNGLAQFK